MVPAPLIDAVQLRAKLGRAVLLDVRSGADARARYDAAHLPGAIWVDLERDLSARPTDPAHGGRHPLPAATAFAELVGRWGIDPDSDVVAYDAASGANAAARAWWMLRSLGHERCAVLDGGYDAAVRAGLPTTAALPLPADRGPYPSSAWHWPTIDADAVDLWRRDPAHLVVDARSPARFRGEEELIDPVAGHIPGAANLFHLSLVDERGALLAPGAVAARVREVVGDRRIDAVAVHCGSGVTACLLVLAMVHAGLGVPRLYVGSWSEWCRANRPRGPVR
ncbi:MAG: sulfurtransferase [Myxococcales bacterium]|nr:sulfurtransferase [Myxococcales bacterium]